MSVGFGQALLVVLLVFVLFGAGKLPQVMSELGKGLKLLRKNMTDEQSDTDKNLSDIKDIFENK